MFRENLSETIGLIDLLGSIQPDLSFCNIAGEKFRRWLDVCAHAQLQCDLSGNSDVIAGNHRYLHAVGTSPSYGALGIGAGADPATEEFPETSRGHRLWQERRQ
jgi:hypothetical protein